MTKKAASKTTRQKPLVRVAKSIGLVAWVIAAMIGVGAFGVVLVLQIFAPSLMSWLLASSVGGLLLNSVMYLVALLLLLEPYRYFKGLAWRDMLKIVGLDKPFRANMVLWAVGMFLVSLLVAGLLAELIQSVIPGVNMDEAQDTGFNGASGLLGLTAAFLALVVVAPLLEEAIFRGFLYGQLRKYSGAITSSLLVSLTFGAVHLQFNVAVVTFVLSLFMCYLREKFDSIWPGVLVHVLKNGLAFALLFG